MITVEKDKQAEEIFIHGSPESLRDFAKKLWAIAEKSDTKGKYKEQLTPDSDSDTYLSTKLHGEPGKHSVIKKLTISSRTG